MRYIKNYINDSRTEIICQINFKGCRESSGILQPLLKNEVFIELANLVGTSPDMHLLSLCDQLVAELRVRYGDDRFGLLPCGETF